MSLRRAFLPVLSVLAIMASSARADFNIFVVYGPDPTTDFVRLVDGGFGDIDGVVNGSITGDTTLVESAVGGDFRFSAIGGTSDAPGTGGTAFLTQTYQVSGTGSLRIIASANDYNLPNATSLSVRSAGTSNFGGTGGSVTYVSRVDDSNAAPSSSPIGAPTSVLTFALPGVDAQFTVATIPVSGSFALNNESNFTLAGGSLQFTGRTDVIGAGPRGVPEPASMAMLTLGGLGILGAARRRKAKA